MRPAGRGAVLVALGALLSACGSTETFRANPGAYDRVPDGWHEKLSTARIAFERGDAHDAYALVAPLTLEQPRVLPVRIFQQEIELELLARDGRLGSLSVGAGEDAAAILAREYEHSADASPSAEGYVLAARLAASAETGLALLDEAGVLDPRCVWVSYGRAWWRFGLRRFREARDGVRAALHLDAGHLPTLRLHSILLAGAGDYERAAETLEVWLDRTADDPLFSGAERADALLDLAALEVMLEEPRDALARLDELDPRAVRDPARAEEVRAAALQERGEFEEALEAVRRANELAPGSVLPLVQEALLHQAAGRPEAERATWERLLALVPEPAKGNGDAAEIDFEVALYRLQARVRLERLGPAAPKP